MPKRRSGQYKEIFGCKASEFPVNYFGYPSSLQEIKEFKLEKGGGAIRETTKRLERKNISLLEAA
jgi:hypothetical protein